VTGKDAANIDSRVETTSISLLTYRVLERLMKSDVMSGYKEKGKDQGAF